MRGEEGGVMRIIKNLMGASGKFYRDITRIIRRQTFPPPPPAFRKLRNKKKQKRRGKWLNLLLSLVKSAKNRWKIALLKFTDEGKVWGKFVKSRLTSAHLFKKVELVVCRKSCLQSMGVFWYLKQSFRWFFPSSTHHRRQIDFTGHEINL